MKKRNILTIALALVLTVVLSVGATLAYLTSTDDQVVNTFTFASGMTVSLWEPKPVTVAGEKISTTSETRPDGGSEVGWNYENVVPGQTLNKAPTLSTKTTVNAYVFVEISGASADVAPVSVNWRAVERGTADDNYNGIYICPVTVVDGQTEYQLGTIFDQVEISENVNTDVTPNAIVIRVYEVQQTDLSEAQALELAKAEFVKQANPTA